MTEITLTLKVKDVEIKLSTKDAKELYEALGSLVGEKVVHVDHWRTAPWWPYWQTWCAANKVNAVGTCQLEGSIPMYQGSGGQVSLSFAAKE